MLTIVISGGPGGPLHCPWNVALCILYKGRHAEFIQLSTRCYVYHQGMPCQYMYTQTFRHQSYCSTCQTCSLRAVVVTTRAIDKQGQNLLKLDNCHVVWYDVAHKRISTMSCLHCTIQVQCVACSVCVCVCVCVGICFSRCRI